MLLLSIWIRQKYYRSRLWPTGKTRSLKSLPFFINGICFFAFLSIMYKSPVFTTARRTWLEFSIKMLYDKNRKFYASIEST